MAQSDFERMQELIEFLNHCRYEYFDLCKLPPTVPNEEYDKLMQELAALQTKTQIYMSNSPALFAQHKTVEELRKGHHPNAILSPATLRAASLHRKVSNGLCGAF